MVTDPFYSRSERERPSTVVERCFSMLQRSHGVERSISRISPMRWWFANGSNAELRTLSRSAYMISVNRHRLLLRVHMPMEEEEQKEGKEQEEQ